MLSFILKTQGEFRRPKSAYEMRRPSLFKKNYQNAFDILQKVIPDLQNIIRQPDSSALESLLGEAKTAISHETSLRNQERPETRKL